MQTWLRAPGIGNSVDLRDSSMVLDQPRQQSAGTPQTELEPRVLL